MNIISCEVRLTQNNYNELYISVNEMPKFGAYTKQGGIYRSDSPEGFVDYFSYSGPTHGFGGRKRKVHMIDGSVEEHIGGWSGRAGVVNNIYNEHVVDVVTVEKGMRIAGAITLELATRLVAESGGTLVKIQEEDYMMGEQKIYGDLVYEIHVETPLDKSDYWYSCACGYETNTPAGIMRRCPKCTQEMEGHEGVEFPPPPEEKCYVL